MQYGGFMLFFDRMEVAEPPQDMVTARVIRVTVEIFFLNIHQMTALVEGLAQVLTG